MAAVKLALVSQDVMSDEELLERMASGDREALGLVFDRHHRALYAFLARAYPVEDADLDDLVQSTFLEAFRAAPRFRGASAPRTWLFAIGKVMQNVNDPGCFLGFASGFTMGNFLGVLIEKRLALGTVVVRAMVPNPERLILPGMAVFVEVTFPKAQAEKGKP